MESLSVAACDHDMVCVAGPLLVIATKQAVRRARLAAQEREALPTDH